LLTFHQTTTNSDELLILRISPQAHGTTSHGTTSHQPRRPIFMVPFDRDETFVGRQDILGCIHQKLNALRRRAVLSGIGGVG
jgi:hypothetical protein